MSDSMRNEIDRMLLSIFGSMDVVVTWWNSPNVQFEFRTPRDIFISGEKGQLRVLTYVANNTRFEGGL